MTELTEEEKKWLKIANSSTDPQKIIEAAAGMGMPGMPLEIAERLTEFNKKYGDEV